MSAWPYYVVETSGYPIGAGGRGAGLRREFEFAVVGPNGLHAHHEVVRRGLQGLGQSHGKRYLSYAEKVRRARAAAHSIAAILNAEARG